MFDILERTEDLDAATEPTPLHPADAADELLAILGRIDQLEAQAATALRRMNDSAKWRRMGYTSATAFLKHRAGFAAGRAMALVTRSNALTAMPFTRTRFESGELSADQVDILCGAYNFNEEAFAEDEAMLVGLAVQLPFVRELWQLLEYWKQRIDPVLVEECQDMLDSLRGIRLRRDNGVGRISGAVNEAEYDTLLNMLDPGPPAPEDHRTLAQRRADRLMELASASMDRPQLVVHVSYDKLVGGDARSGTPLADDPLAETEYGTVLTPDGVIRIACDATVCRIVFGPDGQPLDIGRRFRLFPEPLRRAIIARDRHCRFPGCDRPPRWCDAHHIKHWARGGATSVDNAILLCRFHHTLVHEVGWNITGTPTNPTVHDDLGRVYASARPARARARAPALARAP
ncbi:DUF222 domain-containing protein [Actinomycetota bacterium]